MLDSTKQSTEQDEWPGAFRMKQIQLILFP